MFNVLSPDGISITFDELYKSKEEAETALDKFVERFEDQGYYSGRDRKYSLKELPSKCKIVKV